MSSLFPAASGAVLHASVIIRLAQPSSFLFRSVTVRLSLQAMSHISSQVTAGKALGICPSSLIYRGWRPDGGHPAEGLSMIFSSAGGAGMLSTARVQRGPPRPRVARAKKASRPHPLNFFFSISFTFPGFAFPPLAFITCPTKKPSTCCFPSLNCATCAGFFVSTSVIIFSSAPSSDT